MGPFIDAAKDVFERYCNGKSLHVMSDHLKAVCLPMCIRCISRGIPLCACREYSTNAYRRFYRCHRDLKHPGQRWFWVLFAEKPKKKGRRISLFQRNLLDAANFDQYCKACDRRNYKGNRVA